MSTDHKRGLTSPVTCKACPLSQVPVQFLQKALAVQKYKNTFSPSLVTGHDSPKNKPVSRERQQQRLTSGPGKGWAACYRPECSPWHPGVNSLLAMWSMLCGVYPCEIYSSTVFSMFRLVQPSPRSILRDYHHPKRHPVPVSNPSPAPPQTTASCLSKAPALDIASRWNCIIRRKYIASVTCLFPSASCFHGSSMS